MPHYMRPVEVIWLSGKVKSLSSSLSAHPIKVCTSCVTITVLLSDIIHERFDLAVDLVYNQTAVLVAAEAYNAII